LFDFGTVRESARYSRILLKCYSSELTAQLTWVKQPAFRALAAVCLFDGRGQINHDFKRAMRFEE